MQIHRDISQLPAFKNAVITIGTFDGVHIAHQKILRMMHAEAIAINGETVVITFHPHPKMIVGGYEKSISILNTLEEKISLLKSQGINHLAVIPFTEVFASQTAEEYIKDFLVSKFHPHTIVIGYDHRFGALRKGNYRLLERYASEYHYIVKEIPEHVLHNITISSTKIREALSNADIEMANELLGYHYFFSGKVAEGNKLGRTIGFPTANLQVEDGQKLIPANGVYAVKVEWQGDILLGMLNIGVRPTLNGTERMIEINIFDFNREIYGEVLKVYMIKYLRSEIKFKNLDELKNQLEKDRVNALHILKTIQ